MKTEGLLQPVARAPLSRRVADAIKRFILTEDLQPGEALPAERALAERLVVSRTVLREALSLLVGEGLIAKEAGRGIFVRAFDREQLLATLTLELGEETAHIAELLELRRVIEVGSLGLAAARIGPAQVSRLHALVAAMQAKLAAGESIASEDVQFHQLLLEATGNPAVAQFRFLIEVMRLTVAHNPHSLREERDEGAVRAMAELLAAVERGDVPAARQIMEAHLTLRLPPAHLH